MDVTPTNLQQLPKLELHVHLESTMDGEKLALYAQKQGLTLPRAGHEIYNCSAEDLSNFLSFLDLICSFVGTMTELAEIARDFSLASRQEGICYAEVILNPTHWPQFTTAQLIAAVTAGFDDGSLAGGTDCRFTLSLSRSQSAAEADALLDAMQTHRTPRLAGLSIDGNEALTGRTGERFAPAFRRAAALGFGRTVHAGESSGAEGVADALALLGANRVDHGVRAAEDEALLCHLAKKRVPLNVCLTSNLTLLYRDPQHHPLRHLWDAGIPVTLSRDDPTFLGGLTLSEELRRCAAFAGLTMKDLLQAQYNAVDAAFCSEMDKRTLCEKLDLFAQTL